MYEMKLDMIAHDVIVYPLEEDSNELSHGNYHNGKHCKAPSDIMVFLTSKTFCTNLIVMIQ